jgi:hypothetical protein
VNADYKLRDGYPKLDCHAEWRRYRKLFWTSIALFVSWLPYGILIFTLARASRTTETIGPLIFLGAYMTLFLSVSIMGSNFRCPRCGYRFFAWGPFGLGHNSFARACRNCKLQKWTCS